MPSKMEIHRLCCNRLRVHGGISFLVEKLIEHRRSDELSLQAKSEATIENHVCRRARRLQQRKEGGEMNLKQIRRQTVAAFICVVSGASTILYISELALTSLDLMLRWNEVADIKSPI
jgi:hypothetical protein